MFKEHIYLYHFTLKQMSMGMPINWRDQFLGKICYICQWIRKYLNWFIFSKKNNNMLLTSWGFQSIMREVD